VLSQLGGGYPGGPEVPGAISYKCIDGSCWLVIGPADVAALAVHIMVNTALTGATYDIDGGQQFVW
jgi:hypothetical protein